MGTISSLRCTRPTTPTLRPLPSLPYTVWWEKPSQQYPNRTRTRKQHLYVDKWSKRRQSPRPSMLILFGGVNKWRKGRQQIQQNWFMAEQRVESRAKASLIQGIILGAVGRTRATGIVVTKLQGQKDTSTMVQAGIGRGQQGRSHES